MFPAQLTSADPNQSAVLTSLYSYGPVKTNLKYVLKASKTKSLGNFEVFLGNKIVFWKTQC